MKATKEYSANNELGFTWVHDEVIHFTPQIYIANSRQQKSSHSVLKEKIDSLSENFVFNVCIKIHRQKYQKQLCYYVCCFAKTTRHIM